MLAEPLVLQLNTISYMCLVSFAILYYDYLLTFNMEFERFWKCSCTWATALFYVNRYLTIFGHIPVVFVTFYREGNTVKYTSLQTYHQVLFVILQVIVAALFMMRTYALYDKSRVLLRLLMAYVIIFVSVSAWAVCTARSGGSNDQALAPVTGLSDDQAKHYAIAWSGLLVYDIMVFGLTLTKVIRMRGRTGRPLVDVLLRDGTLYFVVIAAVNLSNIITFLASPPLLRGITTIFTTVISSTLTSRLMLNVRDPTIYSALQGPSSAWSSVQTPVISTVVDPHIVVHTSSTEDEGISHDEQPWGMSASDIVLVRRDIGRPKAN